jgi:Na+/pantothenate symporter
VTFAVVFCLLVPVGLLARRVLGHGIQDTDLVVPQLLIRGDVFSDGTGAFLLVAMVAAAMSSLDSVLLVMASTAERDIMGMLRPSESEATAVRGQTRSSATRSRERWGRTGRRRRSEGVVGVRERSASTHR